MTTRYMLCVVSIATTLLAAIIIGLVLNAHINPAPDARTQALDWFAGISFEEQAAFVDVQLGDARKRRWIAHRWCSLNPDDDWACGKAGIGSPIRRRM